MSSRRLRGGGSFAACGVAFGSRLFRTVGGGEGTSQLSSSAVVWGTILARDWCVACGWAVPARTLTFAAVTSDVATALMFATGADVSPGDVDVLLVGAGDSMCA